MEKKFGTRLFNRTARRLAVTEAGRQLYDRAAHILADGEAAENEVIAISVVPRGRVRLTAPISFGVLHIAPILLEFLAQYPDCRYRRLYTGPIFRIEPPPITRRRNSVLQGQ
jgi:DNA-binding transcriptional LysR family regulator